MSAGLSVQRGRLVAALRRLGSVRALELAARFEGLPADRKAWDDALVGAYLVCMAEHEAALDAADAARLVFLRAVVEQGAAVERADAALALARVLWDGAPGD